MIALIAGISTIIIFILVGSWYNSRRKANCTRMESTYSSFPSISSISKQDDRYQSGIRDYYIKSSYNSCATSNFKHSWVDLCALKSVIKQGCRVLDFEIYNIKGEPVVAASSNTNRFEKGTYNSIPFSDVCQTIADNAFTGSSCPNSNDPLFLNFRIKSIHVEVYDRIADILAEYLDSKMLSSKYSYEFGGNNLTAIPLPLLLNKVIIMVDKRDTDFSSSKLNEFVNIAGNSIFMRILNYDEVIHTNDMQELIEYNKRNITLSLPVLSDIASNYKPTSTMLYGVQMSAMCFQKTDSELSIYIQTFNDVGHAFILKPANLRYSEVTVEAPPPPDPSTTYGYHEKSTNYYDFKF